MSASPHYDVETIDGVTVVTLAGPKLPPEASEPLVELAASAGSGRVVLDFARITFLSSHGLATVATLKKRLDRSGGSLRLCGLADEIASLFRLTGLDRVIEICGSRQEAVERA
jgi:anti-anti-sigma factor